MKMTDLKMVVSYSMEWTDAGAVVSYSSNLLLDIRCPRCNVKVESGIEHRCGHPVKKTKAPKKARP